VLCTGGHNNGEAAKYCVTCGINTFQVESVVVRASNPTNGMAIASMVLGIVWVYWIGSILALVFGYVALGQIKHRGQQGRGMALAGVVLGWVAIGTLIAVIVIVIASSTN
jgi:uncharacterized membrane protein